MINRLSRFVILLAAIVFVSATLLVLPQQADAALTRTDLTASESGTDHGSGSFTSSSFSTPTGALIVAVITSTSLDTDITGGYTVTGGGLAWTKRAAVSATDGDFFWTAMEIWTARATSTGSMAITVDSVVDSPGTFEYTIHAVAYQGYSSASPIGATGSDIALEDGAGQFNLSASPRLSSAVLAARYVGGSGANPNAANPGTGWSEIYDTAINGGLDVGTETQERVASSSASVYWADTIVGGSNPSVNLGLAVEIKAGGALSKPPNNLGLVGYWSFNEGAGTVATDFSGRGNHGTLIGSPVPQWVSGKRGSALDFTGISTSNIDIVDVANESNFDFERTQPFTIAAWVNHEGNAHENYLVSKTVVFGEQYNLTIPSNNSVRLKLANTTESAVAIMTTSANSLTNNRWHHVVATYDGTSTSTGILIYVDGVSQSLSQTGSTAASLSGTILNNQRLAIGSLAFDFADADVGMQGKIDEVRIYNRVLAASEIAGLYGQGTGASGAVQVGAPATVLQQGSSLTQGLVGHWPFDGPDISDFVYDRAGNDDNGYFFGGATSSEKAQGKLGQGFNGDGVDNEIFINPVSSELQVSGSHTLAAWFKGRTYPTGSTYRTLLSKFGDYYLETLDDEPTCGFHYLPDDFSDHPTTGVNLVAGTWYHIVCVFNDSENTVRIYVNGVERLNDPESNSPNPTTNPMCLVSNCGSQVVDGTLDDVRVYNRALTATEVKQLYNLGQTTIRP